MAQLDQVIAHGPHQSAVEHADFFCAEMTEMCRRGQWMVLPYQSVRRLPGLRRCPPGVIPQHEQRPRTIFDYTFYGINSDTVKLAPPEAMQFGTTLHRLLHQIHFADPQWGPVHLIKVDVSDGSYQIWVAADDIPKLGVMVPTLPREEPLVASPLAQPMGWVESPPTFCAATKTVADLANSALAGIPLHPSHRNDAVADTPTMSDRPPWRPGPPSRHQPRRGRPLSAINVYVDDFIAAVQGGAR